ncbi:hypothetical protein DJ568_03645 [Mucilaginibacter hurinus]|uniref:HTH LytTR-type domain-containing protein n=1 Tax=Mucilaginibacter hurinus TaxID=2201324 RepID=A0A367GQX2_9SPHI|nr:LytTR family DNA-binding domain-containing protein [Mucilaginibacter hurinus]RCH55859.1 hypothetical protein DJ568_03645 [Mucilaginibacter hurinus]
MNIVAIPLQRNPIAKDVLYWTLFVLTWAFLWGLSDQEYVRNIFIQVCSLPARMLLVYFTTWFLFPHYFKTEKYFTFFGLYSILLLVITISIQRPLMLYFIQPHFLPFWNDGHFMGTSEIINTALDINIAAVVPLGYKLTTTYRDRTVQLQPSLEKRPHNAGIPLQFIEVRADKALHKINIDEIIFIESQRNMIKIKLATKEIITREKISSVEGKLSPDNFKRVHRSFLVNINKINATSSGKVLCGDVTVPIGRKYKEALKNSA